MCGLGNLGRFESGSVHGYFLIGSMEISWATILETARL